MSGSSDNRSTPADESTKCPFAGRSRYEILVPAAAVAVVTLLTHAPLLGELGFYRDDWYMLWAGNVHGPGSIYRMFTIDRPGVGFVYSHAFRALGSSPLPWHVYSLLLKTLEALTLLWIIRRVWPRHKFVALAAPLLFVVYPGFLQQPNANTFSNQHLTLTLGLISIGLSVIAATSQHRWRRTFSLVGATLTALAYFLLYEYMIGLEALRLALLWLISRRQNDDLRSTVRTAGASYAPIAATVLGFLSWRLLFFESGRFTTDIGQLGANYAASPLRSAVRLPLRAGLDLLETTFFAWGVPVYDAYIDAELRPLIYGLLLGATAAGVAWMAWRLSADGPGEPAEGSSAAHIAVVGAIATAGMILPIVVAGRDVHWHSGFDRYTLQTSVGVALLLAAGVRAFIDIRLQQPLLLALLLLGTSTHFLNAVHWQDFWRGQRELWWQLSWRAPQLDEDTVLIVQLPVDGYLEDYEAWGPANLTYYQDRGSVVIAAEVLNERTADKIRFGDEDGRYMRNIISIERDFKDVLLIARPTFASCVHVLDGHFLELPADSGGMIRNLAPYSDIGLIQTEADFHQPPSDIFGPEPEPGWCYYYQTASLLRQKGDWRALAALGDRVLEQGFKPSDRSEWLPFLQGFLNVGDSLNADRIVREIRAEESVRHALCDMIATSPVLSAAERQDLDGALCF